MRRLAEFGAGHGPSPWGDPLRELAGEELTILKWKDVEGKYGPLVMMLVRRQEGEERWVYTSSQYIRSLLKSAEDEGAFPVKAVFMMSSGRWTVL